MSDEKILILDDREDTYQYISNSVKKIGLDGRVELVLMDDFADAISKMHKESGVLIMDTRAGGRRMIEVLKTKDELKDSLIVFINGRDKINQVLKGILLSSSPSQEKGYSILENFFTEKLKELVKKMKSGKATNLYSLIHKEMEKTLITFALKETAGNQSQAAQLLGINRNTLGKRIKDLKIPIDKEE